MLPFTRLLKSGSRMGEEEAHLISTLNPKSLLNEKTRRSFDIAEGRLSRGKIAAGKVRDTANYFKGEVDFTALDYTLAKHGIAGSWVGHHANDVLYALPLHTSTLPVRKKNIRMSKAIGRDLIGPKSQSEIRKGFGEARLTVKRQVSELREEIKDNGGFRATRRNVKESRKSSARDGAPTRTRSGRGGL